MLAFIGAGLEEVVADFFSFFLVFLLLFFEGAVVNKGRVVGVEGGSFVSLSALACSVIQLCVRPGL